MLSEGLTRPAVEWRVAGGLTAYPDAGACMEERVPQIAAGERPDLVLVWENT